MTPVDRLLAIVRANSTLCLDVADPGWDDARGYLFDEDSKTLFFPVPAKYLREHDLSHCAVLIWSRPRVRVVGVLSPAQSDRDIQAARAIAIGQGQDPVQVDYMLLDQRTRRARKNRYKLTIDSLSEADA